MLLEDLVEAGEVEVDVLLQLEEVLSDLIHGHSELSVLVEINHRVLDVI